MSNEEIKIVIDKDFLARVFVLNLFRRLPMPYIPSQEFNKIVEVFCKKFNMNKSEFFAYVIDIITYTTAHEYVTLTDRGFKLLEMLDIKKELKKRGIDQFKYRIYL